MMPRSVADNTLKIGDALMRIRKQSASPQNGHMCTTNTLETIRENVLRVVITNQRKINPSEEMIEQLGVTMISKIGILCEINHEIVQ